MPFTPIVGQAHQARRLLELADGLAVRVLVGDLSGAEARETLATELVVLTGQVG